MTDPYLQGKIAVCNVLSDLYSLGLTRCDTMLMVLAESNKIPIEERKIVTMQMMKGFADMAKVAEAPVSGGQSIVNPSPIIGGVGITVCTEEEIIRPCKASAGDLIVLTKPLGTQIAGNLFEWFYSKRQTFEKLVEKPSEEQVNESFNIACDMMSSLNRVPAKLMHQFGAKGATDVTGFGILGHAGNFAAVQHAEVDFVIRKMPVIRGLHRLDKQVRDFKLKEGLSAETSGGLLVVLPRENASGFLEAFEREEGRPAWVVGEVVQGSKKAMIAEGVAVEEV